MLRNFGEYCSNIYDEFLSASNMSGKKAAALFVILSLLIAGGVAVSLIFITAQREVKFEKIEVVNNEEPEKQEEPPVLAVPVYEVPQERLDDPTVAPAYIPRKGKWVLIERNDLKLTFFDDNKDIRSWKIETGNKKLPIGIFKIARIKDGLLTLSSGIAVQTDATPSADIAELQRIVKVGMTAEIIE